MNWKTCVSQLKKAFLLAAVVLASAWATTPIPTYHYWDTYSVVVPYSLIEIQHWRTVYPHSLDSGEATTRDTVTRDSLVRRLDSTYRASKESADLQLWMIGEIIDTLFPVSGWDSTTDDSIASSLGIVGLPLKQGLGATSFSPLVKFRPSEVWKNTSGFQLGSADWVPVRQQYFLYDIGQNAEYFGSASGAIVNPLRFSKVVAGDTLLLCERDSVLQAQRVCVDLTDWRQEVGAEVLGEWPTVTKPQAVLPVVGVLGLRVVNDRLLLELPQAGARIELSDASGKPILNQRFAGSRGSLDIRSLARGTYFVKATSPGWSARGSFNKGAR
jgi:hypothetical protein